MSKRILIEGNNLFGNRTGIGQYTKRLFESVIRQDTQNRYTIFGFQFINKRPEYPIKGFRNLRYRIIRLVPARVFRRFLRKGMVPCIELLLQRRADIVIFPNFVSYPIRKGAKKVLFVYDVSFVTYAKYSHEKNVEYLSEWVPKSINGASKIITISENAKKEIQETYGVAARDIVVVNPALDHSHYKPQPRSSIQSVMKKYQITGPYILFTGTLEPRKNIGGILKAYANLPDNIRQRYTLVLGGGKGWNDDEIITELDRLQKRGEKIIHTGYLDDEDMPPLYSGASVFVFPSFYEGFGMPPVEAMACGTPVICSDNSSLPEAVGDAAIMIKATDTKALTANIIEVLGNKKLCEELRRAGFVQANKFTWDKSAQTLIKVLRDL